MSAAERIAEPGDLFQRLEQLNAIGVALSRETDIGCLLEAILEAAKSITNADGGNDTLGIADIFEALTAPDRPYKKGKTLSESLSILGRFKLEGHIDPDLFDVFMWEKVYLDYAARWMDPQQIDAVDLARIPGYVEPPGQ